MSQIFERIISIIKVQKQVITCQGSCRISAFSDLNRVDGHLWQSLHTMLPRGVLESLQGISRVLSKVSGFGNRAGGVANVYKGASSQLKSIHSEVHMFYWWFQYRRHGKKGQDEWEEYFRATLSMWPQVEFHNNFPPVQRMGNYIRVGQQLLHDKMK